MAKWLQKATERMKKKGTEGSFTRIAKRHGRSVHAEAVADKHKGGKLGKKANFALNVGA